MYLSDLEQIGVLRLDGMTNGDMRLQIPYSGNADVFDVRKEMLVKKYTRYELFKKNGHFAKSRKQKSGTRRAHLMAECLLPPVTPEQLP